ncbi:MAG TPA: UvrB/UvrC motif-containing protein, partial [Ignavibacteriaceae bacterium]|nr:UvrB/UvrC motif-containing protein [Ignavibacteriaceae bacterium]
AFIPSEETEGEENKSEPLEQEEVPKTKEAQLAALQDKLRKAIETEEYERAAKIRDDIQKLTGNN